jgi:hypothetical protein
VCVCVCVCVRVRERAHMHARARTYMCVVMYERCIVHSCVVVVEGVGWVEQDLPGCTGHRFGSLHH